MLFIQPYYQLLTVFVTLSLLFKHGCPIQYLSRVYSYITVPSVTKLNSIVPTPTKFGSNLVHGWRTSGTRVQNGTREDFPWHTAFTAVPKFFFISFVRPTSLCCEEYMYIYTYLTAYRLYMNYRCYQITLQWNIFTQTLSGAKCLLDIYHCGAGLAVTGRMHDIGQNVLQSALPTGSSSSPQLLPYFLSYHIPRGELY